jgi:hypothetical protein
MSTAQNAPRRTIDPEQQAKMAAGRRRAEARRDAVAAERVAAFRAWCVAGIPTRTIPPIPTSGDYARAARAAGVAEVVT